MLVSGSGVGGMTHPGRYRRVVVFVRKSPGRSGSTKVQIAERRAGRDVVLEHVGTARGEAETGSAARGGPSPSEALSRLSKSDLRARPIFHHTRESIEAHLTIVFAALAVARYLQDATGMSIKKIVRTLRPLQQMSVRIAGHDHLAEDPLTPAAQAILDALELTPP